jgi:SAM-dependent methyltransferase
MRVPSASPPPASPTPSEAGRCLGVVVPCYNERATIAEVVARVLASPFTAEVVIVDDGSTDGTRDILRSFDDPRVRVILQPRNVGKGAALRRGFQEATAPFVIVQDADLEYDPAEYATVLEPLLDGRADVCYGSRFHNSRPHRVLYYWHTVGNRLLTTASNAMTNLNLTDMETCYKAFRREVITSIDIEEDRFGFEPEVTAKVAAAGWRIYEVGISYSGRTYAEGKKIGWRDGLRALYCIGRYSRPGRRLGEGAAPQDRAASFEEADDELAETLHSLDGADRYTDWLMTMFAPHLKGDIVEVGAGHGTLTERLAAYGPVTAIEPSERAVRHLQARFADRSGVTVVHGDHESAKPASADTIVLSNVLEHIPDDVAALAALRRALRPGGRIIVFSPAFDVLYSRFDAMVGHQRRYRRRPLAVRMRRAGLEVVENRYVNWLGALVWLGYARILRQVPTKPGPLTIYDRVAVPAVRWTEQRRRPPFGQSVLCVAETSG